ncbi:MAG: hypothetical protein ABFS38_17930 [Bacteroidota bacterium]
MEKYISLLIISIVSMIVLAPEMAAQDTTQSKPGTEQQQQFVDEDGDGYNDNAPDHDGDGIPNRFDSDWKRRQRSGKQTFVDLDGDGINDHLQTGEEGDRQQMEVKAGEENGASMKNQEQHQRRRGSKRKGSGT